MMKVEKMMFFEALGLFTVMLNDFLQRFINGKVFDVESEVYQQIEFWVIYTACL